MAVLGEQGLGCVGVKYNILLHAHALHPQNSVPPRPIPIRTSLLQLPHRWRVPLTAPAPSTPPGSWPRGGMGLVQGAQLVQLVPLWAPRSPLLHQLLQAQCGLLLQWLLQARMSQLRRPQAQCPLLLLWVPWVLLRRQPWAQLLPRKQQRWPWIRREVTQRARTRTHARPAGSGAR